MSCVNPRPYFVPAGGGRPKPLMEDLPSGSVGAHGRIVYLPCGNCLQCRIAKRRDLTVQQILEASMHQWNWFLTLTYDEEHLPANGSLVKEHLSAFCESMRHYCKSRNEKFRFFACGEYGDKYGRPHYHLSVFGLSPDCLGLDINSRYDTRTWLFNRGRFVPTSNTCKDSNGNLVWFSNVVANRWPYGDHKIYLANVNTFQYVAGYVTKKLSGDERKKFEQSGKINIFTKQSRPSIGFPWYSVHYDDIMKEFDGKLYHDFIATSSFDWRIPRIMMKWHERRLSPLQYRQIGLIRSKDMEPVPDRDDLARRKISDELNTRRFKQNNKHKEL